MMMNVKKVCKTAKGRLRIAVFSMIAMVLALFTTLFALTEKNAGKIQSAQAWDNTVSPYVVGQDATSSTLYQYNPDTNRYVFNTDVIQDLFNVLTYGNTHKAGKTATIDDVSNAITGNVSGKYFYMSGETIRDKANAGRAGLAMDLGIGGSGMSGKWQVVYVSKNNPSSGSYDAGGTDVYATLWYSGSADSGKFHGTSAAGSAIYASSDLRLSLKDKVLVDAEWDAKYLVQPTYIQWQRDEKCFGDNTQATNPIYAGNDGYGIDPSQGQWQYDRVWLPSGYEVYGANGRLTEADVEGKGLWGILKEQRKVAVSTAQNYWLRSAAKANYAWYIKSGGGKPSSTSTKTTSKMHIRPAIHLNLTRLAEELTKFVISPADVTREYTGQAIDLSAETWFKNSNKYYTNTDVVTTSPALTDIKNVGTYNVMFTVEEPNPEDVHWEDGAIGSKYATFTITKKKLKVTGFTYTEADGITGITTTGQVAGETTPMEAFRLRYTDSSGNALVGEDPYTRPDKAGSYRVYPELDDGKVTANPDLQAFFNNYEVKVEATCFKPIAISNVIPPADLEREYSGVGVVISDADWYSGSKTYYDNSALITFSPALSTIVEVKKHKVTVTLANNTQNIYWTDTKTFGSRDIYITIVPRTVTVTDFAYDEATGKVTSVTATGYLGSDAPSAAAFKYKYTAEDGSALADPYTKPKAAGKYRVYAEFNQAEVDADNTLKTYFKNYNVVIDPDSFLPLIVVGIPKPLAVTKVYTGSVVDITKESWYSTTYFGDDTYVSYTLDKKDVGTYNITFQLKSTLLWTDGSSGDVVIEVKINPRPLGASVLWNEETLTPSAVFQSIAGDPESGLIDGDTVTAKFRYTYPNGEVVDSTDPYARPTKKGDYRVYAELDTTGAAANYTISNNAFKEFHLKGIDDPTDIHVTYTGKPIDLTTQPWYSEEYYGTGGLVDCPDLSELINCPSWKGLEYYQVSFALKSTSKLTWASGSTARSVDIRIYIDPKPIYVRFVQNLETNVLMVVPYDGEICEVDVMSPPVFTKKFIKYDTEAKKELPETASEEEPDRLGIYHVYPVIKKEGSASNFNYVLAQDDYYFNYSVQSEIVKTPTVVDDTLTVAYTGDWINFTLSADTLAKMGSDAEARIKEYVHTVELSNQGVNYDPATHTFTVKDVGTYQIKFELASTDFTWDTLGGYMTITIERAEIELSELEGLEGDLVANTDYIVKIKHNAGSADYDKVGFILTYQREGDAPVNVLMKPHMSGGLYTDKVAAKLNIKKTGNFTVKITLAPTNMPGCTSNKNYNMTESFKTTITIYGKPATVSSADLIWKYRNSLATTSIFNADNSVEYNTREYTVYLDQSNLAELGVKVKGYSNESYTKANADGNKYSTFVQLTAYDDSWEFNEDDGSFEFQWTIKKGLYDLTNVKWDYRGVAFSYTGTPQQVNLTNLYGGLKAQPIDNSKTAVGTYTATAQFAESLDSNYETPKQSDPSSYRFTGSSAGAKFQWTLSWEIKKAQITPLWNTYGGTETNNDGKPISYPQLYSLPDGVVEYTYYKESPTGLGAQISGPKELLIVDGKETGYYIQAAIKTGAPNNYEDCYELLPGVNPYHFTVGSSKIAVKIDYSDPMLSYTGKPVAPEFSVEFVESEGDAQLPSIASFTYMFLEGTEIKGDKSSIPSSIGTYQLIFDLDTMSSKEYYIYGKSSFTYTIKRARTDPSKLYWNYDPSKPFMYELQKDGTPKMHSVELKGLNEDAYSVVYNYDAKENIRNEGSEVGVYTATFEIINLDEVNYESLSWNSLPENLQTCVWEIQSFKIPTPKSDFFTNYDGGEYKIWEKVGLPQDYARYMTTVIKRNDQVIYRNAVTDAGVYKIECTLLPEMVESGKVQWAEGGSNAVRTGQMTIAPISIVVNGWRMRTSQAPVPIFAHAVDSSLYDIEYYYDRMQISERELRNHFGEKLIAKIVAKNDTDNNVVVSAASGADISLEFYLFSTAAKTLVKPRLANAQLMYNGKYQQFTLIGFNAEYMEYVGNSTLQLKDLGEDSVTIRLKAYQNVQWQDETVADVTLKYSIVSSKISATWNLNGAAKINVPNEYDDAIEYTYYDEDGRALSAESLKTGESYTVVARVKPEYLNYFTLGTGTEATTTFEYHKAGEATGDNPQPVVASELPVWQITVTAISILFFAIFAVMALNYSSNARKTERKTKKLQRISYSSVAFLPLLMVREWLGMGETGWTAVALSSLGVALLMCAVMIGFRKKNLRVTEEFEEEQRRVEDEKAAFEEAQRREENRRRDEEMHMMFAGLQSNYSAMANDMHNMLEGSMQQMLGAVNEAVSAALPPAQEQYYDNMLPSGYDTEEYNELRSTVAKKADTLNMLMNEQQSLGYAVETESYNEICRLIDEADQNVNTEGYDEYEALRQIVERQDMMIESMMAERKLYQRGSATPEGDADGERILIADAFNELSEDEQMLYYTVTNYIMGVPEMDEVDGKYAVVFKYRGNTIFMIYIRDGAPYLCYMLDNGVQAEIRLEDNISLEDAKEVIDTCLAREDRY